MMYNLNPGKLYFLFRMTGISIKHSANPQFKIRNPEFIMSSGVSTLSCRQVFLPYRVVRCSHLAGARLGDGTDFEIRNCAGGIFFVYITLPAQS